MPRSAQPISVGYSSEGRKVVLMTTCGEVSLKVVMRGRKADKRGPLPVMITRRGWSWVSGFLEYNIKAERRILKSSSGVQEVDETKSLGAILLDAVFNEVNGGGVELGLKCEIVNSFVDRYDFFSCSESGWKCAGGRSCSVRIGLLILKS